jgi:hypothetical protein
MNADEKGEGPIGFAGVLSAAGMNEFGLPPFSGNLLRACDIRRIMEQGGGWI